jgi:hypothetical protein
VSGRQRQRRVLRVGGGISQRDVAQSEQNTAVGEPAGVRVLRNDS